MAKTIKQMQDGEASYKLKVQKTEAKFGRDVLKAAGKLSQTEILDVLRANAARLVGEALPFPRGLGGEE